RFNDPAIPAHCDPDHHCSFLIAFLLYFSLVHQGPSTKSIASRSPSSSRSSIITGGIGIAIGIALIPCNSVVSFTACGGSFGVAYPPDQGVDVSFLGFLLLPCLFFGLPLFPFDSLGL